MNAYKLIAPTAGEAAAKAAEDAEVLANTAYAVVRAAEEAVARAEIKAEREADAAYAAAQAAALAEVKAAPGYAAALAEVDAERKAAEAVMSARRSAIRDGAVIWVDAIEYGRGSQVGLRVDTDAGSYTATALGTAGIWDGRRGTAYNRTSAECYAVLKAVELACECGLRNCVIRSDSIGGFEHVVPGQCSAYTRRRGQGAKYLRLAKKIAQAVGLKVEFEMCALGENLAEAVNYR